MTFNLTGFRTVLLGCIVAVTPAVLTYIGGVDWTQLGISPPMAAVLSAVFVGLRAMTKTPIGVPPSTPKVEAKIDALRANNPKP